MGVGRYSYVILSQVLWSNVPYLYKPKLHCVYGGLII